MSAETAESTLHTQARGVNIVHLLQAAQGNDYAGVWFDNDTGQFVIPVTSDQARDLVTTSPADSPLGTGEFRTTVVQSTWSELEAAHERLDESLLPLIGDGLVATSLDPRLNAIVIDQAEAVDKVAPSRIQQAIAAEPEINIEVKRVTC